jgi:hypothetical protein
VVICAVYTPHRTSPRSLYGFDERLKEAEPDRDAYDKRDGKKHANHMTCVMIPNNHITGKVKNQVRHDIRTLVHGEYVDQFIRETMVGFVRIRLK